MITRTSINLAVVRKVLKGFNVALKQGEAHILNRKGKRFMTIKKVIYRGIILFKLIGVNGERLTSMVSVAVILLKVEGLVPASVNSFFLNRTI